MIGDHMAGGAEVAGRLYEPNPEEMIKTHTKSREACKRVIQLLEELFDTQAPVHLSGNDNDVLRQIYGSAHLAVREQDKRIKYWMEKIDADT